MILLICIGKIVPSGDFTGSDYLSGISKLILVNHITLNFDRVFIDSVEVTILLPVVVAVAILILVAVIFGVVFMLCYVLSKKKGKLLLPFTMHATIAPFLYSVRICGMYDQHGRQ